jgi:hypothetical protein
MPASISSTFDIVWDGTLTGSAAVIANPGRAFQVVGMVSTGANTAVLTLTRTGAAGDVAVGTSSTANLAAPAVITIANVAVTAEQTLTITASAANVTRAVITCQAADPQTLAVT